MAKVKVKVKVKVILRPTVSRPVRPGVRHPSGTPRPIFPIFSFIIFYTVSSLLMWGIISDERTDVIHSCCWSRQLSHLGSESRQAHDDILLPNPGKLGPLCYPPKNRMVQFHPFSSSTTIRRTTVEVFEPTLTRSDRNRFKLFYDRRSVGQSVLVSGPPSRAYDQIFCYCRKSAVFMFWSVLTDERRGL
jgi:hypothetical protein